MVPAERETFDTGLSVFLDEASVATEDGRASHHIGLAIEWDHMDTDMKPRSSTFDSTPESQYFQEVMRGVLAAVTHRTSFSPARRDFHRDSILRVCA